jgi:hypothetical protein
MLAYLKQPPVIGEFAESCSGHRPWGRHPRSSSHHHCSLPGCDRSIGRNPLHVYGRTFMQGQFEAPCPCGCSHLTCSIVVPSCWERSWL